HVDGAATLRRPAAVAAVVGLVEDGLDDAARDLRVAHGDDIVGGDGEVSVRLVHVGDDVVFGDVGLPHAHDFVDDVDVAVVAVAAIVESKCCGADQKSKKYDGDSFHVSLRASVSRLMRSMSQLFDPVWAVFNAPFSSNGAN